MSDLVDKFTATMSILQAVGLVALAVGAVVLVWLIVQIVRWRQR